METAAASEAFRGETERKGDRNVVSSSWKKDAPLSEEKKRSLRRKILQWKAVVKDEHKRKLALRYMKMASGRRRMAMLEEENKALGAFVGERESFLKEFVGRTRMALMTMFQEEDEEEENNALGSFVGEKGSLLKEFAAQFGWDVLDIMKAEDEEQTWRALRMMFEEDEENEDLEPFVGERESLVDEFMGWSNWMLLEKIKAEDEEAMWRALRMMFQEEEEKKKEVIAEMESDYEAYRASLYRDGWIAVWSRTHGYFEDTTKLGPMRFTDKPAPRYGAMPIDTLQVYSVRVEGIRRGLQWPIDVFGIVAVRDSIDFNRNVIFSRTRDNCQTLTQEDRNLALEGPTRAVLWQDQLTFEVKLTVKGATDTEDNDLSFLVVPFVCRHASHSRQLLRYNTSKLSTLRLSLGHILCSVEATIFVRITEGSWPDGSRAQFAAFATGICPRFVNHRRRVAGVDNKKIILLDSGSGGVPVVAGQDGEIMLSRRVVTVETDGKLRVCVRAWKEASGCGARNGSVRDESVFTPKEAGRSSGLFDIGSCKMEVTVAWSLVSIDG